MTSETMTSALNMYKKATLDAVKEVLPIKVNADTTVHSRFTCLVIEALQKTKSEFKTKKILDLYTKYLIYRDRLAGRDKLEIDD